MEVDCWEVVVADLVAVDDQTEMVAFCHTELEAWEIVVVVVVVDDDDVVVDVVVVDVVVDVVAVVAAVVGAIQECEKAEEEVDELAAFEKLRHFC